MCYVEIVFHQPGQRPGMLKYMDFVHQLHLFHVYNSIPMPKKKREREREIEEKPDGKGLVHHQCDAGRRAD